MTRYRRSPVVRREAACAGIRTRRTNATAPQPAATSDLRRALFNRRPLHCHSELPPQISICWPVIAPASGPSRKAVSAATSSGLM